MNHLLRIAPLNFPSHIIHSIASQYCCSEKKEVRGLASLGLIHVVRSSWLEDCDRERREVPVLQKHIADDLLLPKRYAGSNAGPTTIAQNVEVTDYRSLSRSVSCQSVSNWESIFVSPEHFLKKGIDHCWMLAAIFCILHFPVRFLCQDLKVSDFAFPSMSLMLEKYDAACKWGIEAVTSDWISDCVRIGSYLSKDIGQMKFLLMRWDCTLLVNLFHRLRNQDREGVLPSESLLRSQYVGGIQNSNNKVVRQELDNQMFAKKPRTMEEAVGNDVHRSKRPRDVPVSNEESVEEGKRRHAKEEADIPDIQDKNSPERSLYDISIFPSKPLAIPERPEHHGLIGFSKHSIDRSQRNADADNCHHPSRNRTLDALDDLSETQTESQVVGYEEDLSGRQLIIDRVRTQSSMNSL
ncbi:hypothetical protein MLD38_034048 [Melastoma candidum]|uniref:Uncharacterized protein n=1 Tax=Melastoma candidum TaxID=119954 RepID=A0ACB9M9A6_9MYRT|nr:hypothetical protein MLD38_034048 [Melastoma candidum]